MSTGAWEQKYYVYETLIWTDKWDFSGTLYNPSDTSYEKDTALFLAQSAGLTIRADEVHQVSWTVTGVISVSLVSFFLYKCINTQNKKVVTNADLKEPLL